jgi:deoxyribodipyrimidine photo-lyase
MLQSISDLEQQLQAAGGKLALYHASSEQVIKAVQVRQHIQAVFINRDYTPFSRRRDDEIPSSLE